jgi:exosome complex component RRP40
MEVTEEHLDSGADVQYIASPKDLVLGTIINRHAEGYRVDIGSAQMASLDALAFEGATKRSKPNLKVSLPCPIHPLLLHTEGCGED